MMTLLRIEHSAQAEITTSMSRPTWRSSPDFNAPTLMTMSISRAPSKIARRAGFDATPEPVRTAIVEHGMTPAPLTGRRNSQRQLLGDDVDEMPELVAGHGRSRSRIFERRRMYLGSRIAASSQAATIMRA